MKRLALVGLFALVLDCSTADPSARVDPIGPDRASFEPVARTLVAKCGSLDCHGHANRNYRLYGFGGPRLGAATPDDGDIRPIEVDANYDATIALEPELMREVVLERGARPERLTLIRKGRGEESHKGFVAMVPGDDADRCIVSWLASNTDRAVCDKAAPPR